MTTPDRHPHPPSVRLVGGGRDTELTVPLFTEFVADVASRRTHDGSGPRIHALLVLEEDDDETVERFRGLLILAGGEVVVQAIHEGESFERAAVDGADGLFVGGGLTPAYRDAFIPIAALVRELVAAGTPYLGFSAGAAIAAEHALIGGNCIDGVPVCDEDAGEELVDVTVASGLGLVPFTVDVHAAQWGTVSRLTAAVCAGLTESGIAIDEHTSLHWHGNDAESSPIVAGRGSAWSATVDPERPDRAAVHRVTAAPR
ncbi:Type 1 glutamine amidotransferase-like domain-containing protein [Microbacterium sp.]|uniref:Type 1 glutamine amidotransferase-like domain-containing protein n=1 Tax=Microbacterium sp. TaxID=51671 RepID=UPI003C783591